MAYDNFNVGMIFATHGQLVIHIQKKIDEGPQYSTMLMLLHR